MIHTPERNPSGKWALFVWWLALLSSVIAACQPAGEPSPAADKPSSASAAQPHGDASTLGLQVHSNTGTTLTVDLYYQRPEGQVGPRAAELWLQCSENLELRDAQALDASIKAGRTVIAQADKEPRRVRLVIFGTQSLDAMDTGPLARLTFRLTDSGTVSLAILNRQPLFAPGEANQGLTLGDPLVIGGL